MAIVDLYLQGDHDAVRPLLDALAERSAVVKRAKTEAGVHGWYAVEIIGEQKSFAIEKVEAVVRDVDPDLTAVTDGDLHQRPS